MKLAMEMKAEAMKIIAQAGDANEEGVLLTMSTLTDVGVTAVKMLHVKGFLNRGWI
jgi:nucleolar GTP-binding protein